jgi:hypothetical protein
MSANATITQAMADIGAITPSITSMIGDILNLMLQPPLVIFLGVAFVYAAFRIGLGVYETMRR